MERTSGRLGEPSARRPAALPSPRRAAAVAIALWTLVLGERAVAIRHPAVVESVYARGVYPLLAQWIGRLTGPLPFSVAEVLLLVSAALAIVGMVRALVGWRRRERPWRAIATGLGRLAAALAGGVLAFDLMWGLNYDRAPVASLLGYEEGPWPADELSALTSELLVHAEQLRSGLAEGMGGELRLIDGHAGALRRARDGYGPGRIERLSFPDVRGRPKPVALSPLLSYLGVSGIFIPFTGEANVNTTIPDWEVPFTACHELAHQRGFAREDEANYVAYLACRAHPDRDFQYSGTFRGALYAMSALAHADRDAYARARHDLSAPLRRDLDALAAWRKRYESRLGEMQDRINDAYLKTQGQAEGVRSYGRVVDLLLAERRAAARRSRSER